MQRLRERVSVPILLTDLVWIVAWLVVYFYYHLAERSLVGFVASLIVLYGGLHVIDYLLKGRSRSKQDLNVGK